MRIYADDWQIFVYLRQKLAVNKPYALEWGQWDIWMKDFKKSRPYAFFLTETLPDWIENVAYYIPTPISDIQYYIRNRFIRKTHVLPTGFKPGEYYDLDERILHGVMTALVDYVEIELAYKSRWCKTEESKKAKWKNGRCPEIGLAHLTWEMTLDDPALEKYERSTHQAVVAREVKAIYDWYKARPNRPDPYDASGWTEICDEKRNGGIGFMQKGTPEFERRKNNSLKLLRKIEAQYEKEDQQMLIRVIKIRRSLWT